MGKIYKYFSHEMLEIVFARDEYCGIKCSFPKDYNDPFELFLSIDLSVDSNLLAFYSDVVQDIPQLSHKNPVQKSVSTDPKQSVGYLAEPFLDRGEKVGYNKGKPWRDATIKLYRRAVPWFVEFVGPKTNISEVNKEHVKSIRDILLLRPRGLSSKISVFKIEQADEEDCASRTTTRNEFGAICKFLRWCENESYIDKAPINVEGIAKPVTLKANKKELFTPDQLNDLFSSPLFSGRKKRKRPHEAGPYIIKDELYWALGSVLGKVSK